MGFESDEPRFLEFLKNCVQLRKGRKPFPNGYDPFEGLWLKLPTPFKVGDIVYQGNARIDCGKERKEAFVLLNMANWGEERNCVRMAIQTKNISQEWSILFSII